MKHLPVFVFLRFLDWDPMNGIISWFNVVTKTKDDMKWSVSTWENTWQLLCCKIITTLLFLLQPKLSTFNDRTQVYYLFIVRPAAVNTPNLTAEKYTGGHFKTGSLLLHSVVANSEYFCNVSVILNDSGMEVTEDSSPTEYILVYHVLWRLDRRQSNCANESLQLLYDWDTCCRGIAVCPHTSSDVITRSPDPVFSFL